MAFIKKNWKDRISQFPNRRTINDGNVTKQVTVGRDEGAITEEGDAFNATNMNDLEQRIEDAYGDVAALVADEVANQYDSANVIFDAEPTEGHGTGYTVTSEGIKNAIDSGLAQTKTASGSIVHITDGADNIPVKSLTSEIVAVESGNGQPKSPTNPYTISGFDNGIITRCGKNLLENKGTTTTVNGVTFTVNSDGSIALSGTASANFRFNINSDIKLKSAKYTMSNGNTNLIFGISLFAVTPSGNKDVNRTTGFVTFEDSVSIVALWITSGTNTNGVTIKPMIELGDTASEFEAYNGNTYTFAFGQTVYGGHFDNKGNLVVTNGFRIYDGSENWVYQAPNTFRLAIPTGAKPATVPKNCNMFTPSLSGADDTIFFGSANMVITSAYFGGDINAFKSILSGNNLKIGYKLANPITLSITSQDIPTLLGENNIFSNCGDVEVAYYVDTEAIYAIRDVIDEFAMQSDWNEADNTKADYIKNKPTIPTNADFSLSGLSDTDISSSSAGQVLTFDGDNWVNANQIVVKYEEIDVTLDASGEGTLFNSVKFVVGLKDIPSDQLYVAYVSYINVGRTMVKAFSRSAIAFSSQSNVSSTRKVGVYYLDNIATQ